MTVTTGTIDTVDEYKEYWQIGYAHHGMFMSKEYGVEPKVGDEIAVYCVQGSLVRGVDLNGVRVFYKSDEDLAREREEFVADQARKRDEEFAANRERMDAEYEALPDVFKRRIDWFRAHNPRWRQEFESYEMAACRDAVKIAAAAAVYPKGGERPERARGPWVQHFSKASGAEQKDMVPDLAYDEHSGNSFGFAVRLAYLFVTDPNMVYLEHGALTPLVGCEEYGCAHPRDEL